MNYTKSIITLCAVSLIAFCNVKAQIDNKKQKKNIEMERTGSSSFIFGKETPWEDLGGGVKRQILGYDGQLMMVKVKFEKGAVGQVHHHYQSQCTYVASGKFEFTINGVTKIVSEGDCLFKTPDTVHGCVCLEPGILIDTFSPMRQDFLKKEAK